MKRNQSDQYLPGCVELHYALSPRTESGRTATPYVTAVFGFTGMFQNISPIYLADHVLSECFSCLPACHPQARQQMPQTPVVEHKGNVTHLTADWRLSASS